MVDDPPDAPDAAVDILSVQALDEPAWLYLAVDVGHEVSLQSLPGTLRLLLDVDGDRSTGGSTYGMSGVDLVIDLSPISQTGGGRGAGFALRTVADDGTTREVERHALGLMAAPTWAAPRFELRLSRAGADGVPPLERRLRLEAVYTEEGAVADQTDVGSFTFETPLADEGRASDDASRTGRSEGSYRVATWNVASGSFIRRSPDFARVLGALEPDVILLDELPGDVTAAAIESWLESSALAELGTWHVVLGGTGGVQRAAVAARDRPMEAASSLTTVPYPPDALASLAATGAGDEPPLAATELARGVSTAGAWVELDGRRVLFVAADLQSGGWPGSLRDRLRTLQATLLHRQVASALRTDGPAPVVIGGDLNLVGSRTPLFSLAQRLDVDGSDLVPVDAVRLGERTLATWRNPSDVFAPGRLDFILVPDAAMTAANSFVFATEDLDDRALDHLGLERDLTRRLSDHLPVVADLRFGGPSVEPIPTGDRPVGPPSRSR